MGEGHLGLMERSGEYRHPPKLRVQCRFCSWWTTYFKRYGERDKMAYSRLVEHVMIYHEEKFLEVRLYSEGINYDNGHDEV